MRLNRFLLYTLWAGNGLLLAAVWIHNAAQQADGSLALLGGPGWLMALGRLAGLLAAYAALVQLMLIGRVRWIETSFGMDRLARAHHFNGTAVLLLVLAHPALLALGYGRMADQPFLAQLLDFVRSSTDLAAAAVAWVLFVIVVVTSIALIRRRLRYEWWHATHLLAYLAIALAFGHQIEAGSDFSDRPLFARYWIALYAFTAVNLLWYRLIRPLVVSLRRRFVVTRIEPETPDAVSVHIDGSTLLSFRAAAGQFVIVRFLARGFWAEAHPFSLSRRPDGQSLRLTIKSLGDYTSRIKNLPPGTRVLMDGPHGIFTARQCVSGKALLIAGGIGITPLRAMCEDLLASGKSVVLLYGNRTRESIVFAREWEELALHPLLKVHHILSQDPGWPGEKGAIAPALIERLAPDFAKRDIFLCGPPPMMKNLVKALRSRGVPSRRIHYERFAL